jgi:cytochrome c oxidase subunit 2
MNLGDTARKRLHILTLAAALLALFATPQAALAQDAAVAPAAQVAESTAAPVAGAAEEAAPAVAEAAGEAYVPLGPEMIKGMPTDPREDMLAGLTFQDQYSADGEYALWMHDAILLPLITIISLFVLGLLLWVVARYNRRSNPVPSKTSHNTLIEIIWTGLPVVILVLIAIPSMILLSRQYESPPKDALTVKVTGYQWYWGYSYPDNGGFEVISNMLPADEADARGEPHQLAVDNRMVVPVGEPIRVQVTAADVIHAFAVPSLWFKIDAVPGRINERTMTINEPGIYYGQCSELCGARHGYMPIAVEAVPRPQFEAWLRSKGGTVAGDEAAAAPAEAAAEGADAAPAPAGAEAAPAAAPAA